jgi:hypothetical protein
MQVRIIYLIVILIVSVSGWRHITKGFRPHKIIGTLPLGIEINSDKEDKKKAISILQGRFKYLGKGSQAYVFESEKEGYVVKFISLSKYKEPFRRQLLPFFNHYRQDRLLNREKNFKAALRSYKLAYESLKDETGTIYVHLSGSEVFQKKVEIVDNLGQSYQIDINKSFFIIQKKARPLKPYILQLVKEGQFLEIEKTISAYLDLASSVLHKGIINGDSSIKNSGLSEDGFLMEFDIGRFQRVNNLEEKYPFYLQKYTRLYRKFLQKHIPTAIHYFDNKVTFLGVKK